VSTLVGPLLPCEARSIGLVTPPALYDKDVVLGGVPGVMDPREEQNQRAGSDTKDRSVRMEACLVARCCKQRVGGEGKQTVKEPILKNRLVCGLSAHTASDE